jgi:hypothetical protein
MTQSVWRRALAAVATAGVAVGLALTPTGAANAYQPSPSDLFVAQNAASCNKAPCVLYPKATQLPSGRILATFEDSQSAVVGQDLPVHASDDDGTTWRKLADVPAPASISSDSRYAKYTSNWTNAYLYVLPHAVGDLRAGTVLLASIVSGDDAYYNEQKAADPNWRPSGDGDRRDLAIALYSSTDEGASWNIVNIIATGGWQGGSAGAIGRTSAANSTKQVDPLWEPHLVARNGTLIAYYSDENDYLGYDPNTGVPVIDPNNATAPDSHGQILVHKTWDGRGSSSWSQPVVDVPGLTVDRGNGKTQIGGGRPGMTTVAPTTDGKWLLTYEYFGGGDDVHYKIGDDPLRFFAVGDADGDDISRLPVPSGGATLSRGGSPVLTTLADGRIVYNAAGNGSVWVNESGRSDGAWKQYQTPLAPGYSRALQAVQGTNRILVLQAAWAGGSTGPVRYAEVDLGRSTGAYYSLVNRLTGQVLTPDAGKTQDANLTGDAPDLVLRDRDAASDVQRWHLEPKGSNVTLLNKAGGRAAAIWTGNATAGQRLAQWVDDGATDKQWTLVSTSDGYYTIRSVKNSSLVMTGATRSGAVDLQAPVDASSNAAANDAQEWLPVEDAGTVGVPAVLRGTNSNRCLDVPNGATGAQLQIWDCSGNANQAITPTAAGELRVGGRCLGAEADRTAPGTKVILWTCNGATSQKWSFRVDGTIANSASGLVLDVGGWATANGSPVQLWTPLGNATQTFRRG